MENAHHSLSYSRFDAGPVLEMYFAPLDAWKKNLDAFAEASKAAQKLQLEAQPGDAGLTNASGQIQNAGEAIFRRAFELQLELWQFLGKRCGQYLSLPADVSRCRSPIDAAQLQIEFFNKLAEDYGVEGKHLAQTMQQLASDWAAARAIPLPGSQPDRH
jgi:hypothetical protein